MATDALRVRVEGAATAPLLGWEMARQPAGAPAEPHALAAMPRVAAGGAADHGGCRARRARRVVGHRRSGLRRADWWFRCRFAAGPASGAERLLRFGGLATVADVWLNGTLLLHSANMFLTHECDVTAALGDDNELLIRLPRARAAAGGTAPAAPLAHPPGPAAGAALVPDDAAGRMPGWSPPAAPVGPWRPVTLERAAPLAVDAADVRARLDGRPVSSAVSLRVAPRRRPGRARRARGGRRDRAARRPGRWRRHRSRASSGSTDAARWWPHTHGAQPRYAVRVTVHTAAARVGGLRPRGLSHARASTPHGGAVRAPRERRRRCSAAAPAGRRSTSSRSRRRGGAIARRSSWRATPA